MLIYLIRTSRQSQHKQVHFHKTLIYKRNESILHSQFSLEEVYYY